MNNRIITFFPIILTFILAYITLLLMCFISYQAGKNSIIKTTEEIDKQKLSWVFPWSTSAVNLYDWHPYFPYMIERDTSAMIDIIDGKVDSGLYKIVNKYNPKNLSRFIAEYSRLEVEND